MEKAAKFSGETRLEFYELPHQRAAPGPRVGAESARPWGRVGRCPCTARAEYLIAYHLDWIHCSEQLDAASIVSVKISQRYGTRV